MLLYYVRHGEPIYEPDQLTELGHIQAEAVAKRLEKCGIEKIFSSTSNRALQTAAPLCRRLGMEAVKLDWCNEAHAWEELTVINSEGQKVWGCMDPATKRLFARADVRALGWDWHTHPAFAGTAFGAGVERLRRETEQFLAQLGYVHDRENHCYRRESAPCESAALFAHGGAGSGILSAILDIPYPLYAPVFGMGHTGVTVISFAETEGVVYPEVLTSANDGHLYQQGLKDRY